MEPQKNGHTPDAADEADFAKVDAQAVPTLAQS